MTFSNYPIFYAVLVLSVLTYLGALNYLIAYLRRVYTMTWVELGGFTIWDARRRQLDGLFDWYIVGFRTLGFALFSNQYRAVQDRKLTFLIWLVRSSLVLFVVSILVILLSNSIHWLR